MLVTGPAGTGKSALLSHVVSELDKAGKAVLVSAATRGRQRYKCPGIW